MVLETVMPTDLATVFGSIGTILALSACIAGVGYRTWAKYHDKIMAGEVEAFDRKFFYQALVSFGGALVLALPLLTAASEMINQWAGTVGYIIAWIMTAAWAYALNDGVNGTIKSVEGRAVKTAVTSGKLDKAIQERMEFLSNSSKGSKAEGSQGPQTSPSSTGAENTPQSTPADKDPV